MTKKFLCGVKKDHNKLELIDSKHYSTDSTDSSAGEAAIHFTNHNEINKYLNNSCIPYNNNNNLFMFLFFILLLVFLITLICQMFNSNVTPKTSGVTPFGRFSF